MLVMLVLWLITGPELAIGYGLLMGAAALARAITGGLGGAAQSYSGARVSLRLQGHLPWRIMSFLEDARRRGALRREGALYQFRHIRLQERLAARHPLLSDRISAELGLITAELTHVAEDDSLAARHGWQVTIGPGDSYRRYRDARFDLLSKPSAQGDHGQPPG
jgi:hypothetical protein